MSRIIAWLIGAVVSAFILGWSACELAHAYKFPQPAQVPPVVTVTDKGYGIGYACNRSTEIVAWITPWGDPCEYGIYLSPEAGRGRYLHELGHHVDYLIPETDPFRYRFRELIDYRPWRTSPNSPHEKFAEAYSLCARKDLVKVTLWWLRRDFGYDYRPTVRTHRKVCRTIENAMARYPDLFT
jgi:hypothetical protein